jgi:hypothetical protein
LLNDANLAARFTAALQTLQVHGKLLVDENAQRRLLEDITPEDRVSAVSTR